MKYFRDESFVYRDLKPLNVMINDEKYVFIIDFDRLINKNITQNIEIALTNNFSSIFVAPEVNDGDISYFNDIYSIRKMIFYIINEKKIQAMIVKMK